MIWRAALLGGLFSASVQVLVTDTAWAERFTATRWVIGAAADPEPKVAAAEPVLLPPLDEATLAALAALPPEAFSEEAAPPPDAPDAVVAGDAPGTPWTEWALLGWAVCGAGLLALFLLHGRRYTRHLSDRRAVTAGDLPGLLQELREQAGVRRRIRLTVSDQLQAPIALGVVRPEICVPPRALAMNPNLARPLLAHELGHLKRLDPLWLGLARALELVLFFQPLNRMARKRLAACAEFACDAFAVRQTGDRVELARCLAEVAGWLVGEGQARPVCAMADLRSPLAERVERILEEQPAPEHAPAWLAPVAALLLSATAVAAPGFATPSVEFETAPIEPALEPAQDPATDDLTLLWQLVTAELGLLHDELDQLRVHAEDPTLSPATRSRVTAALALGDNLTERHQRIGDLLAAWQALARSQVPSLPLPTVR